MVILSSGHTLKILEESKNTGAWVLLPEQLNQNLWMKGGDWTISEASHEIVVSNTASISKCIKTSNIELYNQRN